MLNYGDFHATVGKPMIYKKFYLCAATAIALSACSSSNDAPSSSAAVATSTVTAEKVEISLIDVLDGVTSSYCLDIAGGNKKKSTLAKVFRPIPVIVIAARSGQIKHSQPVALQIASFTCRTLMSVQQLGLLPQAQR